LRFYNIYTLQKPHESKQTQTIENLSGGFSAFQKLFSFQKETFYE